MTDDRFFRVVHPEDFEVWTEDELSEYAEEHVKDKSKMDWDSLAGVVIDEGGEMWLMDSHSNSLYLPPEFFLLEWNFGSHMFSQVIHNGHIWKRVDE